MTAAAHPRAQDFGPLFAAAAPASRATRLERGRRTLTAFGHTLLDAGRAAPQSVSYAHDRVKIAKRYARDYLILAAPDFAERDQVIAWNMEDIREAGRAVAAGLAQSERNAAHRAQMTLQERVASLFTPR